MDSEKLPARRETKYGLIDRIFGALSPIQAIREEEAINRIAIEEQTKTALMQKDAERTLAMADRKVQADLKIQDHECTLFETKEMLRLEAEAWLQQQADYEFLIHKTGGELHPIDGAEDIAEIKRIYSKNGNGRKK